MNIRYRTNKLAKNLESAALIKKNFGTNAKRVSQRMEDIAAAGNL